MQRNDTYRNLFEVVLAAKVKTTIYGSLFGRDEEKLDLIPITALSLWKVVVPGTKHDFHPVVCPVQVPAMYVYATPHWRNQKKSAMPAISRDTKKEKRCIMKLSSLFAVPSGGTDRGSPAVPVLPRPMVRGGLDVGLHGAILRT